MAGGNAAQQNFRKALGALKNSTKVGIANLNSDYKVIDVAIVKATNHYEVLPKEKHVRTIFDAVSASRPRADAAYCIHRLAKRLAKTRSWAVALKTLIVIHRAMKEVDPTVLVEIVNYSITRGRMLNMAYFNDDSSPEAWAYSSWIRTYALYLEEILECFRILKYDIQRERSRTKNLGTPDLLDQLPALQKLLFRLLACQPDRSASYNFLVQFSLSIVAAESVNLYVAITDGLLNLVDKFFEMQRHDAVRAIEIYRKAMEQADKLSGFFEMCRSLGFGRGKNYAKIEQPPASFIAAMEEYVKGAPQTLMLQWRQDDDDGSTTPTTITIEASKQDADDKEEPDSSEAKEETTPAPPVADLLSFDDVNEEVPEPDNNDALALAIISPEYMSVTTTTSQLTGWELDLVTTPSPNVGAATDTKPVSPSIYKPDGGLDKSMLDRLYDAAIAYTNQNGSYQMREEASNPFEVTTFAQGPYYAPSSVAPPYDFQGPFYAQSSVAAPPYVQNPFDVPSSVAPPTEVQIADGSDSSLQLQQYQQQDESSMASNPANPFGNPFVEHNTAPVSSQTQSANPGLI